MASEGYHEPVESLQSATKDMHRAIQSMIEELEAVTWYNQRIDAAEDPELKEVLAHNRDEEKEHMAMLLEWVRRRDPSFEEALRAYLFTQGSLIAIEEAAESGGAPEGDAGAPAPRLTVGDLTQKQP